MYRGAVRLTNRPVAFRDEASAATGFEMVRARSDDAKLETWSGAVGYRENAATCGPWACEGPVRKF